jgi:hypothetical protein
MVVAAERGFVARLSMLGRLCFRAGPAGGSVTARFETPQTLNFDVARKIETS